MPLTDTTRYELPREGITLLGYIVRRMHKTEMLAAALKHLEAGNSEGALRQVALYAAAASTSYGPAYYQPEFNSTGAEVMEPDPATGWMVSARLESRSPHYRISYRVDLPEGAVFSGSETITGTTVGLRGLGMPAPSTFSLRAGAYSADLVGLITSELALSLFGNTRIRAYGYMDANDNRANRARVELSRAGDVTLKLNEARRESHSLLRLVWREA